VIRATVGCFVLAVACKQEARTDVVRDQAKSKSTPSASASVSSEKTLPRPAPRVLDFPRRKVAPPAIASVEARPAKLAGKSVTFVLCGLDVTSPLRDASFTHAVNDLAIAPDGTVYLLDAASKLRKYVNQDPEGCELALDPTFGKGGVLALDEPDRSFEHLGIDAKGTVFVAGSLFSKKVVSGVVSNWCGSSWQVAAHPSSSLVYSDGKPARDGACEEKRLALEHREDDPFVRIVNLTSDGLAAHASVKGTLPGNRASRAGFYGFDGKEKLLVGKDEGDEHLWSSTDVARCGDWLCVVDGNASALRVWALDGTFAGAVDVDGALGVDVYPKIADATDHDLWLAGAGREKSGANYLGFVARAIAVY